MQIQAPQPKSDASAASRSPSGRGNDAGHFQHGGHFERLLIGKADGSEEAAGTANAEHAESLEQADDTDAADEARGSAPPDPTPATGFASLMRMPQHGGPGSGAPAWMPRGVPDTAAGAGAAAESAAPAASVLEVDAAGAWDVSFHDSRGIALELRAMRPAGSASAGQPVPWTLTVSAPSLEAASLLRHASRLDQRLKARELSFSHVRIQGDDEAST